MGCRVQRVSRELDITQGSTCGLWDHERQGAGGVTAPPLPGYNAEPDVAQSIRRQLRSARLPSKSDRPAERTIPHPSHEARQAWDRRAVREGNRFPCRSRILQAIEKNGRVAVDRCKLLLGNRLCPDIVRRPSPFEGNGITRKVLVRRLHKGEASHVMVLLSGERHFGGIPWCAIARRQDGLRTAVTSISTSQPGLARAATWKALRVGTFGCAEVAKNLV